MLPRLPARRDRFSFSLRTLKRLMQSSGAAAIIGIPTATASDRTCCVLNSTEAFCLGTAHRTPHPVSFTRRRFREALRRRVFPSEQFQQIGERTMPLTLHFVL